LPNAFSVDKVCDGRPHVGIVEGRNVCIHGEEFEYVAFFGQQVEAAVSNGIQLVTTRHDRGNIA